MFKGLFIISVLSMDIKSLMVLSGVFNMEKVKATTKFRRHLWQHLICLPPGERS